MSEEVEEFKYLFEELKVIYRNLGKDSKERRNSIKVLENKIRKLDRLKLSFSTVKDKFNSNFHESKLVEKVKLYVTEINKYIEGIDNTLKSRLSVAKSQPLQAGVDFESNSSDSEEEVKMSEKFDLKTAAGLIPVMNSSEIVTKQIIDAIGLYDSLLDNDGKKLLTTYVLKTRLSESAKIRLKQTYTSNNLLIADLKRYFISKKSPYALSFKLQNARQNSKSIDDFGRSLEEILVDLTLTQADGNEQNVDILRPVNEKIAINSFANGLNNQNLRTIIKARNYSNLNDAIRGAQDEEVSMGNPPHVFRIRTNNNNGNYRGNNRGNFRNNPPSRGAFINPRRSNNNNNYSSQGSINANQRKNQSHQNTNFSNRTNSNFNSNRRGNHYNHRGYFMQSTNVTDVNSGNSRSNTDSRQLEQNKLFFRD